MITPTTVGSPTDRSAPRHLSHLSSADHPHASVTALVTLDEVDLDDEVGFLPGPLMAAVTAGLRIALSL